ncbi:unknown [Clostridium sp. CAG:451]|nr:unknown [Clostridium sp. CAG:451]
MKIDLKKIQLEIDNLDKTINRYEENLLNLYNQLLLTSIYWKDKNSLKFNENVSQEKKEANIKLLELKSVKNTFKYLISKYENIGQKIEFDLTNREKINKFFDDYILQLEKILDQYNEIDMTYFESLSEVLTNQMLSIKKIKDNMQVIKDNVNKIFDKLEDTEIQVAQRLNKIKVEYIKEINSNSI